MILLTRFLGGDKVKEYYGRPSPYTEGTGFLGTPKDYLEVSVSTLSSLFRSQLSKDLGWKIIYRLGHGA